MSYFVCDVEADSPSPATGSMVCFGAVKVDDGLDKTFYGQTAPISDFYKPEALAISGFSRDEHETFPLPAHTMHDFNLWVKDVNRSGRPIFISDNNSFDFMWITYYFDKYGIENPFGWSSRRIGDIFCGIKGNSHVKWKQYRKTEHTHNPVDDAKGNAEAILYLRDELDFSIKLK